MVDNEESNYMYTVNCSLTVVATCTCTVDHFADGTVHVSEITMLHVYMPCEVLTLVVYWLLSVTKLQKCFHSTHRTHFFHIDIVQNVTVDGPSLAAVGTQVGFCVSVQTQLHTKVQLSF